MYQVTFSDQGMSVLNKLDRIKQLEIIEAFGSLTAADLNGGSSAVGKIHRGGKAFFRLRIGDYRIYFEISPDGNTLHAIYLLHQHTIADFAFRLNLPFTEEIALEQQDNFWKYLDSLKKDGEKK